MSIVVADDHPVVRLGVRSILASDPAFQLVGEARDGREAVDLIKRLVPDVLLLDLDMPGLPGLEALRELTAERLKTRTVILTGSIGTKQLLEALQLGARGVVLKEAVAGELIDCIRAVVGGQHWLRGSPVDNLAGVLHELIRQNSAPPEKRFSLTPREMKVIGLIVQGCTNPDIAKECGISVETVKQHLKNIFDKTGVSTRLELAMFAVNMHLIEEP